MSKNFGAKPYMFPQPVLILGTYDAEGKANAMNAAWGGIVDTDKILICLGEHKTTENIRLNKAFTVAMGTAEQVIPCDYVGIVSGSKTPDKMEKSGFTTRKSEFVDAPVINELPLTLECTLYKVVEEELYIGQIVNVVADDAILTDGEIDMAKFHPLAFETAGRGYYALGEKAGEAFRCGAALK